MGDLHTEGKHAGEHLVWEANLQYCREPVTIASGQVLDVGAVVGKVTATDKYVELAPGASDGSEVAAGVLFDAVDATGADKPGVISVRVSSVSESEIGFVAGITVPQQATAVSQLAALGVVVLGTTESQAPQS